MSQYPIRRIEDYTDAFLATLGVFLFMAFWVIAITLGYVQVVVTAYAINYLFKWIHRLKNS